MDFSKLSKTNDSLDKLNEFINVSSNDDEILEASFYVALISYELNKYDEALKVISKNINEDLKKKNNSLYHRFLDLLITLYANTYNLNDAIKWINKKRDNLAVLDIYKADMLLLDVYIKGNESLKAATLCNKLLEDQIDVVEKTKVLRYLVEYYLKLEQYDNALVYIRKLKENTYELDNYNYYYSIYYEAFSTYMIKEYKTALKLNNECLENVMFITEELLIKSYVLDLLIHIKLGEYKKAILKESEYESTILDSTYENKFNFYNACIELYTLDYNKPSLELYKERLESLEKPEEININKYRIDLKPIKIKEEKEEKKTDNYKEDINQVYNIVNDIVKITSKSSNEGIKPKLRDNIIVILDELYSLVSFDVCVIVNHNRRLDGFYYKKNRLYEKEFKDIKNTVIYDVLKTKDEQIYTSRDDLYGKRDIYLDTLYENTDIDSLIAFPIFSNDKVISVIYFYKNDNTLINGYNYELLKFSTLLINDRILNRVLNDNNNLDNSSYKNAFMNLDIPVKYMIDDTIYLNKKAKELLKTNQKMKLNEYMINISVDEYKAYKDFLYGPLEQLSYSFNGIDVLEKKTIINDEIISILSDNAHNAYIEKKENELIYLDNDTKVKNLYSLKLDLEEFIKKEKFSILYLNIKTYNRIFDCYGSGYTQRLIRNTALYLKEYLNTNYIYHLNKDEFYVILDGINDLRTVEKKCLDLMDYLRLNVNKNSSRIEARYNIGALRYKSQTLIKDIDLLLDYVGFALKMANSSPNSFAYFDIEKYKEEFNNTALVANINEAIDNKKVGVSYTQVVDLSNMTTAFYRVNPIIPSLTFDHKTIEKIVNLRGLQLKMDILLIRKIISEVLKVYEKKNKYIIISMKISYDTILYPEFISIMKRLVIDNRLPKGLIVFDLVGRKKDISKEVEQLNMMGIRFMSENISDCMLFEIKYFRVSYLLPYLNTEKGQRVLESLKSMCEPLGLKLIIDGIKINEMNALKEYGINLVSYGKELVLEDILKKMED